jgi:hypothetical protein
MMSISFACYYEEGVHLDGDLDLRLGKCRKIEACLILLMMILYVIRLAGS